MATFYTFQDFCKRLRFFEIIKEEKEKKKTIEKNCS